MARPRTQPSSSELKALQEELRLPGTVPFAKICAYGINGSGKTRMATSGPPALLIDCDEEGDRSVKERSKTVRVLDAKSWDKIGLGYWYLRNARHPFKVAVIDTTTGMNALAMNFVLNENGEWDPTRERPMPRRQDYGRTAMLMRAMLFAYRNLPMHVVFLAQQREIRDNDTQELLRVVPDLPAGSRGALTDCVGILGHMEPKEVRVKSKSGGAKRVWRDHMLVAPDPIIHTKDRTNALGGTLVRPTMDKIIQAWESNPPAEEGE